MPRACRESPRSRVAARPASTRECRRVSTVTTPCATTSSDFRRGPHALGVGAEQRRSCHPAQRRSPPHPAPSPARGGPCRGARTPTSTQPPPAMPRPPRHRPRTAARPAASIPQRAAPPQAARDISSTTSGVAPAAIASRPSITTDVGASAGRLMSSPAARLGKIRSGAVQRSLIRHASQRGRCALHT